MELLAETVEDGPIATELELVVAPPPAE
ncbi:hypothetical protein BO443_70260 [Burkholderia orbicola]